MKKLSAVDALFWLREMLSDNPRIYIPGCSGEPLIFAKAFAERPALAKEATFVGIWIPGVNKIDYAGLHETARSETIFLSADLRNSFDLGKIAVRPLSYVQSYEWLAQTSVDAAVLQVSPPGANGACSLGVSTDFSPAILSHARLKIAHVNPAMPATNGALQIPIESFDAIVEKEHPLLTVEPTAPSADQVIIAGRIATLINDGDTVQFGLGTLQSAMLKALTDKTDLRIHSGMVSDPVMDLLHGSVLSDKSGSLTTGVAIGSRSLYKTLAKDRRVRFAPVSYTHNIATLNTIDNFHAINSIIEIDLFGQANGEYFGHRQVSGTGGLVDFLRGAAQSDGGKAIVALPSTAKSGSISRIVPKLTSPSSSIARADIEFVVTENGIADLRYCTIDERAQRLIAIAHPAHQDKLSGEWRALRRAL